MVGGRTSSATASSGAEPAGRGVAPQLRTQRWKACYLMASSSRALLTEICGPAGGFRVTFGSDLTVWTASHDPLADPFTSHTCLVKGYYVGTTGFLPGVNTV